MSDAPESDCCKSRWRQWVRAHARPVDDATSAAVVAGLRAFIGELEKQSIQQPNEAGGSVPLGGRGTGLILFYRSLPSEMSLDPLADALGWHRFALTRTPPSGPLTLHPALGPTEQHRFGFPQPTAHAPQLRPRQIALALVPGLAFDRHGTRLGHGAGYFDELLARLPDDRPRIGVTPSNLVFAKLPSQPHDIAMTHLATESGVAPVDP